jgi:phage gp29-like protein
VPLGYTERRAMFERAIERARSAYGGGELVRLELQQPVPASTPAKPAAIQPSEVTTAGPLATGFYIPDVQDRWLYRSGTPAEPNQILHFLKLAEWGETRFLFALYEEMYARDGHIRAEIGKACAYVLAAKRDILPMPANARKASVAATAEGILSHRCSDYIESQIYAPGVDFEDAVAWLCSADNFGIAVLEVVVEAGAGPDGMERLRALRRVPPQRLRVILGGTRWEVRTQDQEWVPLDYLMSIGAAIVLEYEPNLVSPARRGLFRTILPLWLLRTQGPLWWGRAVEIFGMPMRVATTTTGSEPKQDAAIQFDEQGSGAFMSLPPGSDVKLLAAQQGEMPHERFLEWAAKEISKVIHHSTQHSDIQRDAGSVASAQSHLEVMLVAAQDRANRVATAVTEQLFAGLIARNFGEDVARVHTPELRFRMKGGQSAAEMLQGAQAIEILQKAGLDIPSSWAYDTFTIPVPDEDEDILEAAAPAPSNLFPFPAGGAGQDPNADPNAEPQPKQLRASRRGVRIQAKQGKELIADLEKKASADAWKAGRGLLAPYVMLLDQAASEGWPLPQLLSRILHRFYAQPEAGSATLRDTLAAVIAEAELRGIGEVRQNRSGT